MNEVLKRIGEIGIIPVVVLNDAKDAKNLGKALMDGGLHCAEVTFRTAAAKESIKIMSETYADLLVGAGTVLTIEQVDEAVEAGAQFIVSPGLNPKIVSYCMEKNIPIVPGTANPSDIELALSLGLEVVKFFPAEAAGGLKMIKAMAAAYTKIKFMPTGGINVNNVTEYLAFDKIIACGGSWMVKSAMIENGEFDKIVALSKEAVRILHGFELKHIGINQDNEKEALALANGLSELFGFEKAEGNSSIFVSDGFEIMKSPYLGKNGHIAIACNDVERAFQYFSRKGIVFRMETAKYKNEKMVVIYMKEEFGGFAMHLVQK